MGAASAPQLCMAGAPTGDGASTLKLSLLLTAMTLMKWDALRDVENLLERTNRSLGWTPGRSLGWLPMLAPDVAANGEWCPCVDIGENDRAFVLKVELPGVKPADVTINVQNDVLTLEGSRQREEESQGQRFHRLERSYGRFLRSFSLPDNVEAGEIAAHFHDGLLEIELPKTAATQARSIEVKINGAGS